MKYIFIFLILFLGQISWSQDLTFLFKGVVENSDVGKREGGVKVDLIQGGTSLYSATTASNGKYTLRGPIDYLKPFSIVFSKNGLVSKKVYFDFSRMNEEDIPPGDSYQPVEKLDMTLFKTRENVDFSFLNNEPVASFDWNTRQMNPRLDAAAMNAMKTRILKLLSDAESQKAQAEINYQKAITEADKLFASKDYEQSLSKYEEALSYKPTEQYPVDKIDELDALILAQQKAALADKQDNEAYYNLIDAADNLRDQGQLEKAVDKYEEALGLKEEQYPKDQVDKILKQIDLLAKEKKYDEAIKRGDAFLKQKSMRAAKDAYIEASTLRPNEQYPKDKLSEIDGLMNAVVEQEALKKKYTDAIAAGDDFFGKEDFSQAKTKYEEALAIEASSAYAKERIATCTKAIADAEAEKEQLAKIAQLLQEGDVSASKKEWQNAIGSYQQVIALDAENAVAKEKIKITEEKLAKESQLAEQDKNYNSLIKEANLLALSNEFEKALEKYNEAKVVKETPDVLAKIVETQKKIDELAALAADEAAKKEIEEQYTTKIKEADLAFSQNNWEEAKTKFKEAQSIQPAQTYPAEKIIVIDQKIAEELAAKQQEDAENAKNEQYNTLISEADALFESSDWSNAKSKYKEAGLVDLTKTYPAERIILIEKKVSEELALKEKEAVEKEKVEKYNTVITSADAAFNSADWENAKVKYQEAKALDDSQSYPTDQMALIEKKIKEELAQQEEELANKEREDKYQALIAEADALFSAKNWSAATDKYKESIKIDASKTYPSDQITKIEGLVAEELGQKEADKLAKEKQEKYTAAIQVADDLFSKEKWEDAITKYQEAKLIDVSQSYPSERIALSEEKIAAMQSQAEQIAAEAKKQANIQQKLSEGETLFSQNKLEQAKIKFDEVLILDESNQTAIDRINAINTQLAANSASENKNAQYNALLDQANSKELSKDYIGAISLLEQALILKPDESQPVQQITKLKALIAKEKESANLNEEYSQAMLKGDNLMAQKDYLGAISEYNKALSFKPNEQEPVDKAAEAERLEKAKDSDENSQYEKIITVAQKKIDAGEYDRAIELLERAKTLRSGDDRPTKMLESIRLIKEKETKYIASMKRGNGLSTQKKYQEAIDEFEKAKSIQPSATEPEQRIIEMRKLMNDSKSAAQNEQLYQEYMSKGLDFKGNKAYIQAIDQYNNALNVKPGDVTAQNKINEINQIIDDLKNKDENNLANKNKFDALVRKADESFGIENFIPAKNKYEEALKIYPDNSYVKSQIEECVKQERLVSVKQAEKEYQKIITAADKYFNIADYEKSKGYYERAISVRSNDPYPKTKLAEINSILNPVTEESVDLKDLGDPFDNSIMDGSFILAQAEAEREFLKKTKVQKKQDQIYIEETIAQQKKKEEHYKATNDIYEVYQSISSESGVKQLSQYELDAALREAKLEIERQEVENKDFEHGENVTDQTLLDVIVQESALEYKSKEEVYQENTDIMEKYNRNLENAMVEDVMNDYDANINASGTITDKKSKFDDGFKEQYDERIEVAQEVTEIHKRATEAQSQASQERADKVSGNQGELDDIQISAEKAAQEQTAYAQDNNEVLKKSTEELAKAHENEIVEEADKYRDNKIIINKEVEQSSEIVEKEKAAHEKKVEYVKQMDAKAHSTEVEAQKGDYDERLAAQKKLENVQTNVETKTFEDGEQVKENATEMDAMTKTHDAKESAKSIGEEDKHQNMQAALNKVEEKPQHSPKIANSLGEEYPEGVSQESFTRSDSDGLVTTMITRRIVVIDGHADVYVRTQTIHGITYSRNGKPSLQSVWNKETQGPHLERHF